MKKILFDPGHGGHDPGAVSNNVEEEDITLSIALSASNLLREAGFFVLCTRDRDTYISPSMRLKMINDYKPDAFISVHCNASANPEAHGIETVYRDEYDKPLAIAIQEAIVRAEGLTDRGIKNDIGDLHRRLAVLGNLKVRACLCEVGFLSNLGDLAVISKIDLVASALAEGIKAWSAAS
jgi:N-acetylmuramoyl-L-alanine amidase